MAGQPERCVNKLYILPDDDSLEKLTKDELTERLRPVIESMHTGHERVMRLGDVRRAKTKAGLISLLRAIQPED